MIMDTSGLSLDDYKRMYEEQMTKNAMLQKQLGEILEAARWFFDMPDNLDNGMAKLIRLEKVYKSMRGW